MSEFDEYSHFHPWVCPICWRVDDDEIKLKRCSACRAISYCGTHHQRQHWPRHKHLCRLIAGGFVTISRVAMKSSQEWKSSLSMQLIQVELQLGRQLEIWEREMFMFSQTCEECGCHIMHPTLTCENCHSVCYCSIQHEEVGEEEHSVWCDALLLSRSCEAVEAKHGVQEVPVPIHVTEAEYQKSNTNMIDFIMHCYATDPKINKFLSEFGTQLGEDNFLSLNANECFKLEKRIVDPYIATLSNVDLCALAYLSDILSYPLSLLYALAATDMGPQLNQVEELRLHVPGAHLGSEAWVMARWEVILHQIPKLKNLEIIFIGPELPGDESGEEIDIVCSDCKENERRLKVSFHSCTYKDYMEKDDRKPDAVVVYNCGFHELAGSPNDTWSPSLPALLRWSNVPVVFTAYCLSEIEKDLQELQKCGCDVIMNPKINPYRALRPYRDWAREDRQQVFFRNACICLVSSKESLRT